MRPGGPTSLSCCASTTLIGCCSRPAAWSAIALAPRVERSGRNEPDGGDSEMHTCVSKSTRTRLRAKARLRARARLKGAWAAHSRYCCGVAGLLRPVASPHLCALRGLILLAALTTLFTTLLAPRLVVVAAVARGLGVVRLERRLIEAFIVAPVGLKRRLAILRARRVVRFDALPQQEHLVLALEGDGESGGREQVGRVLRECVQRDRIARVEPELRVLRSELLTASRQPRSRAKRRHPLLDILLERSIDPSTARGAERAHRLDPPLSFMSRRCATTQLAEPLAFSATAPKHPRNASAKPCAPSATALLARARTRSPITPTERARLCHG